MPTIREMKAVCQQKKINNKGKKVLAGHWYNVLLFRKISIRFTWIFVKLGISANQVSVLMILVGIAGLVLMVPHSIWFNVVGAVLMYFFTILDCSDGEVARWTGKGSIKGVWLDLISHVYYNHLAKALAGLHLYLWLDDVVYLYLAVVAYAISISEHSIRKCQLQLHIDTELIRRSTGRSVINRLYRFVGFILRQLRDIVIVKTLVFVCIFIAYAGLDQFIIWLVWIIPAVGVVDIIYTIQHTYRFELPEMKHHKKI